MGGTLTTQKITGSTGTISTDATGTLNLGGASTAAYLTNNGHLALNSNNVTVGTDYQNANFGSGNAFNGRANVSGSGLILATSATMDLSGPELSGSTLNVGNVRIGGSSSTTLTVTNNGDDTILRGAVQNTNAPSVALSNANFTLNPKGGSSTTTISYTGTTAGSLAGQSLAVVNNFDNVANKTVNLAGNVYQIAVAGSQPATLMLGAERVGGLRLDRHGDDRQCGAQYPWLHGIAILYAQHQLALQRQRRWVGDDGQPRRFDQPGSDRQPRNRHVGDPSPTPWRSPTPRSRWPAAGSPPWRSPASRSRCPATSMRQRWRACRARPSTSGRCAKAPPASRPA